MPGSNLVLGLLVLGGGSVAVWSGITDPEGGMWAGLRNVIAGVGNVKHVSATTAALAQQVAYIGSGTAGAGDSAGGDPVVTPTAYRGGGGTTAPPAAPAAPAPAGANHYSAITGTWSGGGGRRGAIVSTARTWLGVPYRYGGTTRTGVDCSGFAQAVYGANGIRLPRVAAAQALKGRRVSAAAAQPGDLVAFGAPAHHVGIYLGGGQMIHAPHTGTKVRVESVKYGGGTAFYRNLVD